MFEITLREVGNVNVGAGALQKGAEIAGLGGLGSRGKAVEIDDADHFLMGASGSPNLMVELVLNNLNGS